MSPQDRADLADFSGCFACGLCDQYPRPAGASRRGLMSLVLASTRSTPDFGACAADWQTWPEEELRRAEPSCPAKIPFRRLALFVQRHSRRPRV